MKLTLELKLRMSDDDGVKHSSDVYLKGYQGRRLIGQHELPSVCEELTRAAIESMHKDRDRIALLFRKDLFSEWIQ